MLCRVKLCRPFFLPLNSTTRLWSMKGRRPRIVKQQQFDYAYLFGAVCPSTGETEALITPYVDKNIMTRHLEQISEKTAVGRYALVIMDGALLIASWQLRFGLYP